MICLLALIVFGVLGIFSATHRIIAKEALDCVFRRVTLRKCTTGLDKRLKSQITGKLMRSHPKTAKTVYKNFEIISWFFTLVLIWSLIQSGISGYNYAIYGNCNGKTNGEEFCVFDPAGKGKFSTLASNYSGPVVFPDIDDDPSIGPKDAPVKIIEFGCFRCPYTKKAEETMKQVLDYYGEDILFVYRDFALSENHPHADVHAEAVNCALDQEKYWEFKNYMFETQTTMESHTVEGMKKLGEEFGLDTQKFNKCIDDRDYKEEVENDLIAGIKAGVYGTPTFFINNKTIVGPRDFKTFKKIIDEELEEWD
ncbi:thioredoxin domain-containing protein [Candidatus Woesearchaeota archaeon]|nr:thioredoxin domain-containing protein [Candidatus Woesearchaeota archaeon]